MGGLSLGNMVFLVRKSSFYMTNFKKSVLQHQ